VPSAQPARYLKQLVSHLGHRLGTEVRPDGRGVIRFDGGECVLTAEPAALVLTATATDDSALRRIQDVVTRHLERFGTRDGIQVRWSPPE
jgi:caffeoyl-CoA O-methyltransferase